MDNKSLISHSGLIDYINILEAELESANKLLETQNIFLDKYFEYITIQKENELDELEQLKEGYSCFYSEIHGINDV